MTCGLIRVSEMTMKFFDRLLTIVITATLTSAVWIVFGTTLLKMAEDVSADEEPAVVEPAPQPLETPAVSPTPTEEQPLGDVAPPAVETPAAPAVMETPLPPSRSPSASPTNEAEATDTQSDGSDTSDESNGSTSQRV